MALRLAASLSLVGAIVGEWFGDTTGLGVLLLQAMFTENVVGLWAAPCWLRPCSGTGFYGLVAAGRTAARVLERRAMSRALASPSLAVQRGILGAVLLLVACWEGPARGLHLPAYVLPAVSDILGASGPTGTAHRAAG